MKKRQRGSAVYPQFKGIGAFPNKQKCAGYIPEHCLPICKKRKERIKFMRDLEKVCIQPKYNYCTGEERFTFIKLPKCLVEENEKYKGDALLQKSYTVDFLTKKRTQNKGEIQMFYVEDDHDAIISKRIWECVQLEIKRRKKYLEEHGTNSYSHRPESNPFASKIICGDCNKVFARKGWRSSTGVDRKVWQCSERYKVKGVMGCANRHVEEETLIKAYLMAWNALVENREDFMEQWTEQLQSENLLEGYRAEKFIEYTDGAEPLTEMDTDFMLKTLDHIKVFEDGTLLVVFLDGTEIECKNEEE